MSKQTEALKLALEALENLPEMCGIEEAITAVQEALAEQPAQQQEPSEYVQKVIDALYENSDPTSIDAAELLEQMGKQQEPVAWATRMGEYAHIHWGAKRPEYPMVYEIPLYTSPPASKPWVGLTEEDIEAAMPGGIYDCLADPWDCGVGDGDYMRSIKNDVVRIVRAIEAKLKEKNHG